MQNRIINSVHIEVMLRIAESKREKQGEIEQQGGERHSKYKQLCNAVEILNHNLSIPAVLDIRDF
jgi:hypothetical protein